MLFKNNVLVTPLQASNEHVVDLVALVAAEMPARIAVTDKDNAKNRTDADKAVKASQKGNETMKWLPSCLASSWRRCAS